MNCMFHIACSRGYLRIAKGMEQLGCIDIQAQSHDVFETACARGCLDVAQWLYQKNPAIVGEENIESVYAILVHAVSRGDMGLIHWMCLVVRDIDFHYNHDALSWTACKTGQLEILQWMLEMDASIEETIKWDIMFLCACRYAQMNIVQWIWHRQSMVRDNVATCMNAMYIACINNNLQLIRWIYNRATEELPMRARNDRLFRTACTNGFLDIAKWIYSIHPDTNICAEDNDAFQSACINNHVNVVKWLNEVCPGNFQYRIYAFSRRIVHWEIIRSPEPVVVVVPTHPPTPPIFCIHPPNNKYIQLPESSDMCPICEETHVNIVTTCNHAFCETCIISWVNMDTAKHQRRTCPCCRAHMVAAYKLPPHST